MKYILPKWVAIFFDNVICRKKERDPGDSNTNPGIKGANLKEKCASGMRMRIFLNNEDSLFITLSPPPVRLAGKLFTFNF